ncbi:unnamed protein product, partial [marine sediment metagenome]
LRPIPKGIIMSYVEAEVLFIKENPIPPVT